MKCKTCYSHALNISRESGYCDVCYYKRPLLDLLAIIHRDGGHYTAENGLERSVNDAKIILEGRKGNDPIK